jgi:hypothetical protein
MSTYQPNIPQPGQLISISQNDILQNFQQLNAAWLVNHVDFNTAPLGKHNLVEFPNQSSAPAGAASEMTLFSQLASGVSQLFYIRNAGTPFQLTGKDPIVAASGSTFLPGGIILQWGTWTLASGVPNAAVSFAQTFPTNVFALTFGSNPTPDPKNLPIFSALTTSGFTGSRVTGSSGGTYTYYYIAIGN